jgi:hypothetical protein
MDSLAVSALSVVLDAAAADAVDRLRRAERLHADTINASPFDLRLLAACLSAIHARRHRGNGCAALVLANLVAYGAHRSLRGVDRMLVARLLAARGYHVWVWECEVSCFSVVWAPFDIKLFPKSTYVRPTGALEAATPVPSPWCDQCHYGGRGWATDESVAMDPSALFCCVECAHAWVAAQVSIVD